MGIEIVVCGLREKSVSCSVVDGPNSHTVQKQSSGLAVRCDTLKQRQGIANSVGSGCGELRWVQERVNGDDLL